jgi:ASC-1-like (ASCH) protein
VYKRQVQQLLPFATFAELVDATPASWLGYQESDKPYLRSAMHEIYSPDEEAKYGVLGIKCTAIN